MVAGRPRTFCKEQALEKALNVFWEKGYEGTSLQDLTEAMGINKPSLYAAFGNKETLFVKAMDRYTNINSCVAELLDKPTARKSIENFLYNTADMLSDPNTPHTCLAVSGALSCSDDSIYIKQLLASKRESTQKEIERRLEKAQADGDLSSSADTAALARFVSTISYGLSVQASSGATFEQMKDIIDTALSSWPTSN